ncbi:hypothetical protein [Salinarimonas soli]|uniref:Uncharacterized protein n=1 Tax=Salinarimonas soli TaxID=1638099 RepID=A0A5B2VPV0_9HYPH|nr:hypothetical protein [Salinarimonas soli]KAA2241151.1 hypothetical protein F0L46_04965 [Salinarimonas soli]
MNSNPIFGMIAGLGDAFTSSYAAGEKRARENRLRQTLSGLAAGGNYAEAGRQLIAEGEVGGGVSLIKLGEDQRLRQQQLEAGQAFGQSLSGLLGGGGGGGGFQAPPRAPAGSRVSSIGPDIADPEGVSGDFLRARNADPVGPGIRPILNLARRDGGNDYGALTFKQDGTPGGSAELGNMTIAQVMEFQKQMPAQGHASTAVGAYQMISPTLARAVEAEGLDPATTRFTPEVQDRLAARLVRMRGFDDYQAGRMPADTFARNLSQEWAALPKDASGAGTYDNFNGNRASVPWAEVAGALGGQGAAGIRVAGPGAGQISAPYTPGSGAPIQSLANLGNPPTSRADVDARYGPNGATPNRRAYASLTADMPNSGATPLPSGPSAPGAADMPAVGSAPAQASGFAVPGGGGVLPTPRQVDAPVQGAPGGQGPQPQRGGFDPQRLVQAIPMLAQAAGSAALPEGQRNVANTLLGQALKAADPSWSIVDLGPQGRAHYNPRTREMIPIAGTAQTYTDLPQANGEILQRDATGKLSVARPGDKGTSDVQEYRLYQEQARARGQEPEDFTTWNRGNKRAGATTINNIPGQGKFEETLAAKQAERWNGYIIAADEAQARLGDIETLRETSRRAGSQGSSANFKALVGPYLESAKIPVEGLDDIQLYDSLVKRLAPQMRAPGSGSTSDIEYKGFVASIGPLSNSPAAREMIFDTFEAASRNELARGEIATRLATGEISRADAEKQLRALPTPLQAFREFRKQNPDLVGDAIRQGRDAAKRSDAGGVRVAPLGERTPLPDGYSMGRVVKEARDAVAAGRDRNEVARRLGAYGLNPDEVLPR